MIGQDKNNFVEYEILSALNSGSPRLSGMITTLYFGGLAILFLLIGGSLIYGAFTEVLNSLLT